MATIVLTSGTSWIAPPNWNNSNNIIYLIGGGGGGSGSASDTNLRAGGAGGGGGAYTRLTNVTLTPGVAYTYAIGLGGTAGAAGGTSSTGGNGGNTTFNNGITTYTANGGTGGSATTTPLASTGGAGGTAQTVSGLITQAFAGGSGGNGGTHTVNGQASGGGGGAGGPSGRGGNGGSCLPNTGSGMGGGAGGGNGGGSNGGASTLATPGTAGIGGNNYSGAGGGINGTGSNAGGNGSAGGGGGGSSGAGNPGQGGNGGNGVDITSSVGSGGGAGGMGRDAGSNNSATAGLYGGGGAGGASTNAAQRNGSAGAQGAIVIIYNPSIKTVFITATGTGTFTVPGDFQSLVSVEAIGGGGVGSFGQGGGGGGGAYAISTAVTGLAAGRTAFYQVGVSATSTTNSATSGSTALTATASTGRIIVGMVVSGSGSIPANTTVTAVSGTAITLSAATTGSVSNASLVFSATDTWFNVASNAAPTLTTQGVLAKGGEPTSTTSGGTGGASGSCVGTTVYSGGNGGSRLTASILMAGGGGAAGPAGAGWKGGDVLVTATGGNSGGGGAGGGSGSAGADISSTVNGAGGNGPLGTGSGAANGGAGTAETGGGGGGNSGGGAVGGAGATYNWWLGTAGSFATPAADIESYAGPGGGGGGSSGGSAVGGAGGLYGGGGGGGSPNGVRGVSAQGIIVFSYNPSGLGINNFPYQPATGFKTISSDTSNTQDLGQRYITKDYLLDVYPNIASATGARVAPGLWAWGFNPTLQLGINTSTATNYSSPVQIGALANWKDVSAGYGSSFSIKTDGTLWAWGGWRYTGGWTQGELGLGTNGIYYSSPVQVGALTNWKQISAGVVTIAAVKTDGTLWTWGLNNSSAINLGFTLGCNGIMGNGNTVNYSSPVQVGTLTNWKQVAMSARTCHAIKTDGTLWAWGHNYIGSMGTSYGGSVYYSSPVQVGALTNWKQIAADESAVAVKTDGTLWTWGVNTFGQLGNGNRTSYSSPIQVGTLTNWKQVSASGGGVMACYAIKTDGTLWAWGNNTNGQLGNGNRTSYSSPIQVGTLTNWKKVVGQSFTVYAIKTDGTLWTWGRGVQGQFGTGFAGGAAYYSSPIQVGSLTNWKNIPTTGGAGQHMLAIQDGYI